MNNNNRVHDIKNLKSSILPCGHPLDDNAELYYFCKECKDYQLKINTARDKNDKKLVGLFLIVSIAIGIIIPPILYSIVKTTMVFSIFYMALTIAVILFAPLVFTFHNWDRTIVGKSAAKTLLQINATIIIGILFFLQLNPTPSVVLLGVHAGGNRELCFRFCYMQPHLSTSSSEVAG